MTAVDDQTGMIREVASRTFSEVSKGYTYFQSGDVLFAKITPCMQNGKHAVVPELAGRFGFGSTEFHVLRPSPEVLPEWIHFFVRQPTLLREAEGSLQGAVGQQRVPAAFLEDVELPIPDLPTQRRVVSRLKAQMAVVEQGRQAAHEACNSLQPFLDKTISESFHGIIPLSLGSDESMAPKGWRWHSLLDFARLESGHTPSRRCPEYWENGDIPWLALPDIRALDCRVAEGTGEKTNALGIANSSARILPPDTVALSRTASVGFVTIFGREMATSQDFVNWVCGPDLQPPFLMWLLRAARKFIKGVSTGAVHQTVYMDVVERFRVCIPDVPTQQKIATRLDEAFRLIGELQSAHLAQLQALDRLPGAYLRAAFGNFT